jgi:tetratricopeptide (TPR) repeat protein
MTRTPPTQRTRIAVRALLCVLLVAVAAPVFGQEKARTYTLAQPPLEIRDRLPDLGMGPVPRLPAGERKLLTRVWESKEKRPAALLKIDEANLLDAMLYASGAETAAQRKHYREQTEELVVKARKALKGTKDAKERGEKLMKFLHANVMKKGYESGQTSFTLMLDTGKFNCVSSAALYYIVGTRLGMDLRIIAIPAKGPEEGHVSLDMIVGGKRVQVEPTSPDGFDWQTKISRPGVAVTAKLPDRKNGHEVDGAGLAAQVYYNRGVALGRDKAKQLDAARCYLAALCLDPVDENTTNNLIATFVNWGGPDLIGAKKYEEAVRVLSFGLSIAPKSELLVNNLRVAWAKSIDAALQSGQDREALALMGRAAKSVPGGDFPTAAQWYVSRGEACLKDGDWEAGLTVAARGLRVLPAEEAKKVREWRAVVFRRWSEWFLDEKQGSDIEASVKVLVRAYALDESDKTTIAGILFHTQEAVRILDRKQGLKAVLAHVEALRKQFPKVNEVANVASNHGRKAVQALVEAKKFKEALAAVDHYRPLLVSAEQAADVIGFVYAAWAQDLAGAKQWKAALDKCAEGLKAVPNQARLLQAVRVIVDDWADAAVKAAHWDEAIGIYDTGLTYLPGDSHLQHNKEYCGKMKKSALAQ